MRTDLIELGAGDKRCWGIIQQRARMYQMFPVGAYTSLEDIILLHFNDKTLVFNRYARIYEWLDFQELCINEHVIAIFNIEGIKRIVDNSIKISLDRLLDSEPNIRTTKNWSDTVNYKYLTSTPEKDIILNSRREDIEGKDLSIYNVIYDCERRNDNYVYDNLAVKTILEIYGFLPLSFNRDLLFSKNN